MKTSIKLCILLSGYLLASAAQAGGATEAWGFAPETRLYMGGSLGAADLNEFKDGHTHTAKLFTGIRYRAVGAEIAYLRTGEAHSSGNMPRDPVLKSDMNALSAVAMGYLPLSARIELLGKLGATYWQQANSSEVQLTNTRDESDDQGFSPLLGIGAQYRLYRNIELRSEWERIFATGEGMYESNVDLLSLGVSLSTL